MNKLYSALLLCIASWHSADAQLGFFFPDTLIAETVVGDPITNMQTIPTGSDLGWINYDQDLGVGHCVTGGELTPRGWFVEGDLGFLDPLETNNYAFTSCSFLTGGIQNHNWLILPPVSIPDSTYQLCWRSLAFEGPAYMDGYKVLASDSSNLPASGHFSHVLFKAAEMMDPIPNILTLNLNDYVFSEGYIHANGYTDTNYYFLVPPGGPYRGRLEPHCVSLAEFAGKAIYLAFHHDSKDDSQMQLDDIVISNDMTNAVRPLTNLLNFSVIPNPAKSKTYVQWKLEKPEAGWLRLYDLSGKLVQEKHFSAYADGQLFIDLETLKAGVYHCTIQTVTGFATRKLVKL